MTQVDTVEGTVDVAQLGPTLMHEHVVNLTPEFARDYPHLAWPGGYDAILARVVEYMKSIESRGIKTIVDATTFGHGRDMEFVRRVNDQVDLNVIVSTGYYTKDDVGFTLAPPVAFRGGMERDILIDMIIHDATEGIAGTGIRAGIIKCATDEPGVTPIIDRILRACAIGHRETGLPITTHTVKPENGRDQQRIFAEEGVDLTRVIIGHSGDTTDLDYLREIMDRGSLMGADRFGLYYSGMPTFEERVNTVATLCAEGYSDRIVLSHDWTGHTDWWDEDTPEFLEGFPPAGWIPTHVSDDVVPALRGRGVNDDQITDMLVRNPRRIFETKRPY